MLRINLGYVYNFQKSFQKQLEIPLTFLKKELMPYIFKTENQNYCIKNLSPICKSNKQTDSLNENE